MRAAGLIPAILSGARAPSPYTHYRLRFPETMTGNNSIAIAEVALAVAGSRITATSVAGSDQESLATLSSAALDGDPGTAWSATSAAGPGTSFPDGHWMVFTLTAGAPVPDRLELVAHPQGFRSGWSPIEIVLEGGTYTSAWSTEATLATLSTTPDWVPAERRTFEL